jgi:hypothetical protein
VGNLTERQPYFLFSGGVEFGAAGVGTGVGGGTIGAPPLPFSSGALGIGVNDGACLPS